MNVHPGGRSVVLTGTQLPGHDEALPERAWFAEVHYLALVCEDEELAARLRARPPWRGVSEETVVEMQRFNRWVKENAAATSQPLTLLDTTAVDPAVTVAAVADWVRERLEPREPGSR